MRQPVLLILWLSALVLSAACKRAAHPIPGDPPDPGMDTVLFPPLAEIEEDYISTNRVVWQKPEAVIQLLGDLNDKTIADIGAGTGFFALRLSPLAQKVIAIDIEPKFVAYLDSIRRIELPPGFAQRLEPRLGEAQDAKLKRQEVDIVLIVNTYMYIANRVDYLKSLRPGIRPKGRILIVDFKKKRTSLGPRTDMRIPQFEVEEELNRAGFRILQSNDTALDYQYIILAEKVGNE